jgi:hypothetical protein
MKDVAMVARQIWDCSNIHGLQLSFFFHFSLHLIFFLLCWPRGHEESSAV